MHLQVSRVWLLQSEVETVNVLHALKFLDALLLLCALQAAEHLSESCVLSYAPGHFFPSLHSTDFSRPLFGLLVEKQICQKTNHSCAFEF